MKNIEKKFKAFVRKNGIEIHDEGMAAKLAIKTTEYVNENKIGQLTAMLWALQVVQEERDEELEREENAIRTAVETAREQEYSLHNEATEVMATAYECKISHERLIEILSDCLEKPLRKTKKELPIREIVIKYLKNIK